MSSQIADRKQRQELVEDALALLVDIEDRRRVIRVQAWNRGDFGQIFAEATGMKDEVEALKRKLVVLWNGSRKGARIA